MAVVRTESKERGVYSPSYIVVSVFPPEINKRIEEIQNKYNLRIPAKIKPVGPHLTLKSPFNPTVPFEELEQKLSEAADRATAFPIELNGINCFGRNRSLVYISVTDSTSPHIADLHRNIVGVLSGMTEDRGGNKFELGSFTSHVTIGEGKPSEDVWEKLLKEEINFKLSLDSFSLFYSPRIDGPWILRRVFMLGNAGQRYRSQQSPRPL